MADVMARLHALADGEGEATWFLGALMQAKATGEQTEGRFDLLDQRMPPAYAVPLHVHRDEDEAWYLLEGSMRFRCGDQELDAGAGTWVFAPRGIPHTFVAGPAGARALTFAFPSGFASFVTEAGRPAERLEIPPDEPADPARLSAIAARFGIEILGPPPH